MSQLPITAPRVPTQTAIAQADDVFQQNGLIKINFSDEENMEAHLLREYSRLHLHLKGSHVFAERDQVWASMTPIASGAVVYVIFHIKHSDLNGFSQNSTIHRHDAILQYEGTREDGHENSTLNSRDTTLLARELVNMPDFFFRPRFKGRQAGRGSFMSTLRPSFLSIGRVFSGLKSGLQ